MLEVKIKSKQYNKHKVLGEINIKFPSKGLYFIVGNSGCGKTSLLNIMQGLDNDYEGDVLFNKKSIKKNHKYREYVIKNHFSMLFQEINLIQDMTVNDNLSVVCIDEDKIENQLTNYDLIEFKNKNCSTLSGGEQQRIALIRCLLKDFDILFCDEPTGSLDSYNSNIVYKELYKIAESKLVIVVTHDDNVITNSSNVINLNSGEIHMDQKEKRIDKETHNICRKDINCKKYSKFLRKKDERKIKIVSFSIFIMFIFLLFAINLQASSDTLIDRTLQTFENTNMISITKKNTVFSDDKITIYKDVRPNIKEIDSLRASILNDCSIDLSIDYIFSSATVFIGDRVVESDCIFVPYSSSSNVIKTNNDFFQIYGNEGIRLTNEIAYDLDKKGAQELLNLDMYYDKYEIVNEFSYISTPKIYYPYQYYLSYLKTIDLTDSNIYKTNAKNWYEIFLEIENDSNMSSTSLQVVLENKISLMEYRNIADKVAKTNLYSVSSISHEYVDAFSKLFISIVQFINIFTLIATFSSLSLIGFSIYQSVSKQHTNIAILRSVGVTIGEIRNVFLSSYSVYLTVGILSGFCVNFVSILIINEILNKNLFVPNAIFLHIGLLLAACVLFIVFIIILISLICLNIKRISIKKELTTL